MMPNHKIKSLFLVLLTITVVAAKNDKLKEIFSWKEVDFVFPDEESRKQAIESGTFIKENCLPLGLEVFKDKLFVTLPRWKTGIPATLTYVSLNDLENKSPNLIPYPDWDSNIIHGSKHVTKPVIVSTFRIRADACDRLWVFDTGIENVLGHREQVSDPKLIIYNLNDDSVLRVYTIKPEHRMQKSFFGNTAVDVTSSTCDKAFAYLPDLGSNALIVYSWEKNDSWRLTHHYFSLDPLAGNYNVGGINFHWSDGIFGVALSPVKDGHRMLYFHPLTSYYEFSVSTEILQDEKLAIESTKSVNSIYHKFNVLGSRGSVSQATSSFLDENSGVLFYTLVNKNAIGCWNSFKHPNEYSINTNGIVASDDETMVFPNDLKVDRNDNLWVLADRLPIYMYKKLNNEEINFRVFKATVADALKGTVCDNI